MSRTIDSVYEEILEYLKDNDDLFTEIIEELDNYNGYLADERYSPMEYLNEYFYGKEPTEILYRAFYGYDEDSYSTDSSGNRIYEQFNPNREYFRFNGYGNLVSTDYRDYSGSLDTWFIDSCLNEINNLISISEDDTLSNLFEELANLKKKERE